MNISARFPSPIQTKTRQPATAYQVVKWKAPILKFGIKTGPGISAEDCTNTLREWKQEFYQAAQTGNNAQVKRMLQEFPELSSKAKSHPFPEIFRGLNEALMQNNREMVLDIAKADRRFAREALFLACNRSLRSEGEHYSEMVDTLLTDIKFDQQDIDHIQSQIILEALPALTFYRPEPTSGTDSGKGESKQGIPALILLITQAMARFRQVLQ